jgi:uncharacterized membrane protein YecN with MAPEG domain
MYFPVTAFYASLLGLLLIFLSARVSRNRRRAKVSLGIGEDAILEKTVRAHANFCEYVPLALILLFVLELEISQIWLLHLLGAMLLVGRLLHAYGVMSPRAINFGRFYGSGLTWLMVLSSSLLNLWHLV